jgi:DNA-binding CsgD family transcriptional regulator
VNEPALRLTAVQREVLALICQGKSNPDIARLRKRSLHTIRNLVARLFVVFGVSSREELAVEAVRRGLYAPK